MVDLSKITWRRWNFCVTTTVTYFRKELIRCTKPKIFRYLSAFSGLFFQGITASPWEWAACAENPNSKNHNKVIYKKQQQQQQQKQCCVFITRLSPKMALVSVSQLSVHFLHGQFHPHPLPSSVTNTCINQPQRRHMIVNSDNWIFLRPSLQSLYEWFNCVVLQLCSGQDRNSNIWFICDWGTVTVSTRLNKLFCMKLKPAAFI